METRCYALISNNTVQAVAMADDPAAFAGVCELALAALPWTRPGDILIDGALPPEPAPEPSAVLTPEEARAAAVAAIKNRSWRAETGGITVLGMAIATDRESQAMITGAVVSSLLKPDEIIRWQTAELTEAGTPLFVYLTAEHLQAVGLAVRAHVQACFDLRDAKCKAVAALTGAEDIAAWLVENLDVGWPKREEETADAAGAEKGAG